MSVWLREIRRCWFDVGVSETYLNASSPKAALSLVQADFSSAVSSALSSASLVTFILSTCVTCVSGP